jgi:hypothetical protein
MGNIALAKRGHILKLKENSICLEAAPSVVKPNIAPLQKRGTMFLF